MTRDPLYIAAALCAILVLSEWLARNTPLRHAGTALLVILVTAVAANLRLLPAGSTAEAPVPLYDGIFGYVAPLGIFWLLLACNLRDILKAGLPLIALFLIGALGVLLGALLAGQLFGSLRDLTPLYAAVGGMYVGTYIGGSINFNAVALEYGVMRDGALFAGTVVVDNVITTAWMVATLALPRVLAPLWPRRTTSNAAASGPISGVEQDTATLHPVDLAILFGLGFGALVAANRLTAALAQAGITVPSIAVLTLVALVLAQVPAVARLRGARLLGMFAVYVFLAVIGAFCDIVKLVELGWTGMLLLGFAGTMVLVHGVIAFGSARALRLDTDLAAVASQANVGGGTSALAVARSLGRDDLVLPAVLIGSLGNAIGTFLAFWAVSLLAG